jgi:hypothetical protein
MKIKLAPEDEQHFINLGKKKIYLEGNILKVIESESSDFLEYLRLAKDNDTSNRKKRLEVTRQVQEQNKELQTKALELQSKADENDRLMDELKVALTSAENAKREIENDLDVLQKRTQFELIGNIVQIALYVIVGVGVVVTGMYLFAMATLSTETTLIGNTWSNLFGILLTNSFSIIGTIMGVKYASESRKDE